MWMDDGGNQNYSTTLTHKEFKFKWESQINCPVIQLYFSLLLDTLFFLDWQKKGQLPEFKKTFLF